MFSFLSFQFQEKHTEDEERNNPACGTTWMCSSGWRRRKREKVTERLSDSFWRLRPSFWGKKAGSAFRKLKNRCRVIGCLSQKSKNGGSWQSKGPMEWLMDKITGVQILCVCLWASTWTKSSDILQPVLNMHAFLYRQQPHSQQQHPGRWQFDQQFQGGRGGALVNQGRGAVCVHQWQYSTTPPASTQKTFPCSPRDQRGWKQKPHNHTRALSVNCPQGCSLFFVFLFLKKGEINTKINSTSIFSPVLVCLLEQRHLLLFC